MSHAPLLRWNLFSSDAWNLREKRVISFLAMFSPMSTKHPSLLRVHILLHVAPGPGLSAKLCKVSINPTSVYEYE